MVSLRLADERSRVLQGCMFFGFGLVAGCFGLCCLVMKGISLPSTNFYLLEV